jgi:hypothetical protein
MMEMPKMIQTWKEVNIFPLSMHMVGFQLTVVCNSGAMVVDGKNGQNSGIGAAVVYGLGFKHKSNRSVLYISI